MRLWKTLLVAISVAILPLALVGVGQAQQMTCWGLRPNLPERTKNANCSEQVPAKMNEDVKERTIDAGRHAERPIDTENADSH